MHAEKEKLNFGHFSVKNENGQHQVFALTTHQQFLISPLQNQYLEALKSGLSVEDMVLKFLNTGYLVRFGELFDLLNTFNQHRLIQNQSWIETLSHPHSRPDFIELSPSKNKSSVEDLNALPFFSGLSTSLLDLFSAHSLIYDCDSNTRLCTQGQLTRDLFVLCQGQASVIRQVEGQNQILAKLTPPAVFGEGGFFFHQPRSADVVTTQKSRVIRIHHHPDIENRIQKDQASKLYRRMWTLHALARSELFKKIPIEAWNDTALSESPKPFSAAATLFREGERGASFFILVQGRISIWQNQRKINTLEQGQCLGEVALFSGRGVRSATALVDQDCLVVEIQAASFYRLLARHLLLAKELEQLAYERIQQDRLRRAQ